MPDAPSSRRALLLGGVGLAAVAGGAAWWWAGRDRPAGLFEFELSDAEWEARLSEAEYAVLRLSATEEPFSSPLNDETRAGSYACAGCGNVVYDAAHKFDSGTGWPSFWQATAGDVVGVRPDPKILGLATEAFCARCGGHLGHVFDDGPEPTGQRHCINGIALDFAAA
ncbi:peptide-methionine (R)-S-oxide reductase MsrB [Jannaschia sp. Os4]|uniref:peptide-methionine (R)-S-oxide reductase MsrB n=1 Tax=Jannaschia sp. Os4 TaxID=2807617 RepID=UPI001939360C|nr:peptide-methionine (R)-S-oxide reductase MsrB [Jannaschia sp. Os4]MBM2576158.1 peptide-methionine (R)-S-oxide reductase MsrB [Jannaschia sp. Os4]